jgi:hypothetical protein
MRFANLPNHLLPSIVPRCGDLQCTLNTPWQWKSLRKTLLRQPAKRENRLTRVVRPTRLGIESSVTSASRRPGAFHEDLCMGANEPNGQGAGGPSGSTAHAGTVLSAVLFHWNTGTKYHELCTITGSPLIFADGPALTQALLLMRGSVSADACRNIRHS